MHGLGNDFIVIDATEQSFQLNATRIKQLSDRHFGIGFDQLLVVEPPANEHVDFTYRIFNADGNEVEQCGNGARCFARYITDKNLTSKKEIPVATHTGNIILIVNDDGLITVDMGKPILSPADIPLIADTQKTRYQLDANNKTYAFGAVSMGNPHAVITVDQLEDMDIEPTGKLFQQHKRFPASVNVGFMQIINRREIALRVYERGVGETMACGTGACAAAVSAILQEETDHLLSVILPGGTLTIDWQGNGHSVYMTGPAESVFEGTIEV
ncbi:MAG: Diaminopimelate epimerase (EC [uncultured Thiotrichaceae bacterium]|uniref:Diaminopimelate epimerase n=1 Tax=uncultured Thiotrichaceae bacterium TaxID=298394 RepID=A0A6S6UEW5_9GAMM|nr:MAG: Diaminopimelate epimerase (EC [uncultured Thiotrichaceae bacterium]